MCANQYKALHCQLQRLLVLRLSLVGLWMPMLAHQLLLPGYRCSALPNISCALETIERVWKYVLIIAALVYAPGRAAVGRPHPRCVPLKMCISDAYPHSCICICGYALVVSSRKCWAAPTPVAPEEHVPQDPSICFGG